MWAFGLVQGPPGSPQIDMTVTPYAGHVYVGSIAGWGGYLISGTLAQLQALQATPQVVGIAMLTSNDTAKWKELDAVITPAMKVKLNTWLTARGWPTIPAGWTARQIINFAMKRLNPNFKIENEWVTD